MKLRNILLQIAFAKLAQRSKFFNAQRRTGNIIHKIQVALTCGLYKMRRLIPMRAHMDFRERGSFSGSERIKIDRFPHTRGLLCQHHRAPMAVIGD